MGGEEGERVGHCVPGSIILKAKALRRKRAWLVEGRLRARGTQDTAGGVGWSQILQALLAMERSLEFVSCTER